MVLTYDARRIVIGGHRYVRVRMKVTVPVGLTAFLAGPMGRRFARWDRNIEAGSHVARLAIPERVHLVRGRQYHLEMYFAGGGQKTGLRRTIIR